MPWRAWDCMSLHKQSQWAGTLQAAYYIQHGLPRDARRKLSSPREHFQHSINARVLYNCHSMTMSTVGFELCVLSFGSQRVSNAILFSSTDSCLWSLDVSASNPNQHRWKPFLFSCATILTDSHCTLFSGHHHNTVEHRNSCALSNCQFNTQRQRKTSKSSLSIDFSGYCVLLWVNIVFVCVLKDIESLLCGSRIFQTTRSFSVNLN